MALRSGSMGLLWVHGTMVRGPWCYVGGPWCNVGGPWCYLGVHVATIANEGALYARPVEGMTWNLRTMLIG